MGKEKLSKQNLRHLSSIARDGHKSISERMDALNRLSNSQYFHGRKRKSSLIRRAVERVIRLL